MNHDLPAGRDACCCGTLPVGIVWIRNVKCAVKSAVCIPAVDGVEALRCFMIAFALLGFAITSAQ
jgi:hypothetical protein